MTTEKKKGKKKWLVILLLLLAFLIACVSGIAIYYYNLINFDKDFAATTYLTPFENEKVTNIALFGLDARQDIESGRSDAILILTVDREHGKLKLSSVDFDSCVEIDRIDKNGNPYTVNDRLTNAYMYGGPELAVNTINKNFSMDIEDYVTVNYFQFVEILDYIGGIEVHVDKDEMGKMNRLYIPGLVKIGIPCEKIEQPGFQRLTGAQALAYCRECFSPGKDVRRADRHREILTEIYKKIKSMESIITFDRIIKIFCENSITSMTPYEIADVALWTLNNKPSIDVLRLPTDDCNPKNGIVNKVWCTSYDLEKATEELHTFIKR